MAVDPGTLEEAQRRLAARDWLGACELLEPLVDANPAQRMWLYALCDALINGGGAARARPRLEALAGAGDPEANFLAARADAAMGRQAQAAERFRSLRASLPAPSAALEAHLARSLEILGDLEGARDARERAVGASPNDAGARIELARLAAATRPRDEALAHLDAAIRSGPVEAEAWRGIGRLCAGLFDWPRAVQALTRAVALEPDDLATETLLATALGQVGESIAARDALARVMARDPDHLDAAVRTRLMLPQVYAHRAHVEACRQGFEAGLDELGEASGRFGRRAADVFTLDHSNFLLAYQGRDDRADQAAYSRFIAGLARRAAPELAEPLPRRFDGGRPLRVGFCSSFLRECTVGRYFERWITALDPRRFEVRLYPYGPLADAFTERLGASAAALVRLPGRLEEAAAALRADALDVLVHPEIGMDPWGYVLATLRLAPVQLAAWGHPVTTGSDAIDAFLTVDAMEPEGAERHYLEPLIRLPGVGVDYAMPPPAAARDRADFGLPSGARVYACPQSLFKIHPDMDAVFARIAAADPEAHLLFVRGLGPAVDRAFGERLRTAFAAAGATPAQVRFAPRLPHPDFAALLRCCDVVVDTLHWSGGNTSFDTLAVATPVVARPGEFMRGRQTAAMLRAMGLDELVADSPEALADLAVALARDRDRAAGLRERIAAARGAIFERPEPVRAFAQALLAAGAGEAPGRYT